MRKILVDLLGVYILTCAFVVTVAGAAIIFRVVTDTGCVSGTIYGAPFAFGKCEVADVQK